MNYEAKSRNPVYFWKTETVSGIKFYNILKCCTGCCKNKHIYTSKQLQGSERQKCHRVLLGFVQGVVGHSQMVYEAKQFLKRFYKQAIPSVLKGSQSNQAALTGYVDETSTESHSKVT